MGKNANNGASGWFTWAVEQKAVHGKYHFE